MSTPSDMVQVYLRARYPILYVQSVEEVRAEQAIIGVAAALKMDVLLWSVTDGFTGTEGRNGPDRGKDLNDPVKALGRIRDQKSRALFIMRDLHRFMTEPLVVRALRDLARELRVAPADAARAVVLLCPIVTLPVDLEKDITVVPWPLPTRDDLGAVLGECLASLDARAAGDRDAKIKAALIVGRDRALDGTSEGEIIEAALGLTTEEASNVFSRSLVQVKRLDPRVILSEKEQIVRKDGVLKWMRPTGGLDQLGGYERVKRWTHDVKESLTPEARAFGLPPVKGILLAGPPGCGKTEIAKAIAYELGVPLLGYDLSRAMSKWQGEGQERNRQALARANTLRPAALFMDEVDKQFAGLQGSGETDGGTKLEMFGEVLTSLSESQGDDAPPLIVIACANDVSRVPAPFYRAGRLDEMYWVDLPGRVGREDILRIHVARRRREPKEFALDEVALATDGYSGAELEKVVVKALRLAFRDGRREPTTDDLLLAVSTTPPQSKGTPELEAQRKVATERKFELASEPELEAAAGSGRRVLL